MTNRSLRRKVFLRQCDSSFYLGFVLLQCHFIAREGDDREGSTRLLKIFQPSRQSVFNNEVTMLEKLSRDGNSHIPSIRWHAKGEM